MGQKNALYFCAGLAIGILGTLGFLWFYQEPEKESIDIPEERIAEVPQEPEKKVEDTSSIDSYQPPVVSTMTDYAKIATTLYGSNVRVDEVVQKDIAPYRITEEEYEEGNENGQYELCGLTLYIDGTLANDITDDVLTEAEAFVELGPNYTAQQLKDIFERSPDDVLFIRNDKLFTQYEITYDIRTYREVTDRNPHDGSYGT